jgi:TetR/AcrR family transcriptional repressor of nem operon
MGSKGEATRENILSISQSIMLQKGFAGTSLDEIIAASNITKGGFFYHFNSKDDLAVHLMLRYQRDDINFFNGLFDRAEELSEDPLQQMLIFLKLLSEAMAEVQKNHPGCLVATFTSANQTVNQQVRDVTAECLVIWRESFRDKFERINDKYPKDVDLDTLADMLSSIIEGGIIVALALSNTRILVDQILQYRNYIRLLYGDVS